MELLKIEKSRGVLQVTIAFPPINLLTRTLFRELRDAVIIAESDTSIRVFVLRSALPDFFLCHFDVETLLNLAESRRNSSAPWDTSQPNPFNELCERIRCLNAVSIAELRGRVGGGGSELALSFDMRFGELGSTVVSHMEVPLGLVPGGGGTQRLPRSIGSSRALEMLVSGCELDAKTAEAWGYLNRVLPEGELTSFVDTLCERILASPPDAVIAAKHAVRVAEEHPLREGLQVEKELFDRLLSRDEAVRRMRAFLTQGGQTLQGELDLEGVLARLGQ